MKNEFERFMKSFVDESLKTQINNLNRDTYLETKIKGIPILIAKVSGTVFAVAMFAEHGSMFAAVTTEKLQAIFYTFAAGVSSKQVAMKFMRQELENFDDIYEDIVTEFLFELLSARLEGDRCKISQFDELLNALCGKPANFIHTHENLMKFKEREIN